MTKLPLRPNVCLLIQNKQGLLFLGERADESGHWQFPQGGIKKGDTPEETVLKEASEELGASIEQFRVEKKLSARYEYEWSTPPPYGKDTWRGQTQTFWIVSFLGEPSDINLEQSDKEFQSFCWCTTDEVIQRAHPLRMLAYEAPLKEFVEYRQSIKL